MPGKKFPQLVVKCFSGMLCNRIGYWDRSTLFNDLLRGVQTGNFLKAGLAKPLLGFSNFFNKRFDFTSPVKLYVELVAKRSKFMLFMKREVIQDADC